MVKILMKTICTSFIFQINHLKKRKLLFILYIYVIIILKMKIMKNENKRLV